MKELGFGLMRLPLLQPDDPKSLDYAQINGLVDRFLDAGFHYFDTAYMYHGGMSESVVRRCLVERHPRERFVVADKMPIWLAKEPAAYEPLFEEQLERTGLSYFDVYLLHALGQASYEKTVERGGFAFMKKMTEAGKIRQPGFSYHDGPELLDRILTEQPEMEVVQLQINYADWEDESIRARACYETAVRHGKRVVVMEPVKGGLLATLPAEAERLMKETAPERSVASWAIRFAASLPGVDTVLSGMGNMEQLEDNIACVTDSRPLTPQERAVIDQAVDILRRTAAIPCTACGYCMDDCPQNIGIRQYFALYNSQHRFGMGDSDRSYYSNLNRRYGKASECIQCGVCESHCPQHLDIRGWLGKVAELFGK